MDLLEEPRTHGEARKVPRGDGFGVIGSRWEISREDSEIERAHGEVDQTETASEVVGCRQHIRNVLLAETVGHHDSDASRVVDKAGLAIAEVDDRVVRKFFP